MVNSTHSTRKIKDRFGAQLARRKDKLSPGALSVAQFIDGNRHAILGLSALEIAMETGTSDATVIRAVQSLGFSGLKDVKETLSEWLGQVDSPVQKMARTTKELGDDVNQAIDFTIESQKASLDALGSPENRSAVAKAVELITEAKEVGVFGIGASGLIAEYTARLFTRSGIPGKYYNQTGVALAESLLKMSEGDVLLMFLHGRAHREALTALAEAKRLSVPVILIVGRDDAPVREQADVSLVIPRSKSDNVALHSQTLFAVEALHLGVSTRIADRSLDTLERLVTLRNNVRPFSR